MSAKPYIDLINISSKSGFMERIEYYRSVIKRVLGEHLEATPEDTQIETLSIQDDASDNYLIVEIGWQAPRRLYNVVFHIRLKDNKIWIEQDWTEEGIARDLLQAGIPAEAIELGFQPPAMRPHIEWPTVIAN